LFSIEDLNALVVERPAKCGTCMKENFLLMVAPLYYLTNLSMHEVVQIDGFQVCKKN
jgi:hypothetical protein